MLYLTLDVPGKAEDQVTALEDICLIRARSSATSSAPSRPTGASALIVRHPATTSTTAPIRDDRFYILTFERVTGDLHFAGHHAHRTKVSPQLCAKRRPRNECAPLIESAVLDDCAVIGIRCRRTSVPWHLNGLHCVSSCVTLGQGSTVDRSTKHCSANLFRSNEFQFPPHW